MVAINSDLVAEWGSVLEMTLISLHQSLHFAALHITPNIYIYKLHIPPNNRKLIHKQKNNSDPNLSSSISIFFCRTGWHLSPHIWQMIPAWYIHSILCRGSNRCFGSCKKKYKVLVQGFGLQPKSSARAQTGLPPRVEGKLHHL